MAGEEDPGTEGYSVPIYTHLDPAGAQNAKRGILDLEGALQRLGNVDISMLDKGLANIAKSAALLASAGIRSMWDQTGMLYEAAAAGLNTEQLYRWQSVGKQLGMQPDTIIKDISTVYQDIARMYAKGELKEDKLKSLGLTRTDIGSFLNAPDNNTRMLSLLEGLRKSELPSDRLLVLMKDSIGEALARAVITARERGTNIPTEYWKSTIFNTKEGQLNSAAFTSEWEALKTTLGSIGNELAATIGKYFVEPLKRLNEAVKRDAPFVAYMIQGPTEQQKSAKDKLEALFEPVKAAKIGAKGMFSGVDESEWDQQVALALTQAVLAGNEAYANRLMELFAKAAGTLKTEKNILGQEYKVIMPSVLEEINKVIRDIYGGKAVPIFNPKGGPTSFAPTINIQTSPEAVGSPKELAGLIMDQIDQQYRKAQDLAQLGVG